MSMLGVDVAPTPPIVALTIVQPPPPAIEPPLSSSIPSFVEQTSPPLPQVQV